jgi:hypothetical protein
MSRVFGDHQTVSFDTVTVVIGQKSLTFTLNFAHHRKKWFDPHRQRPPGDSADMARRINTEKIKPFRLVKYFTFSSLIAVFIGTLVLSLLNIHWARAFQLKKSQDYALVLMENLNHQVFLQFIVPVVLKFGKIELSNPEQFQRMDDVVRSTLHSFHVATVNIYDMKNKVSYSFDPDLVGKENLGGALYDRARDGDIGYKLVQQGYKWGCTSL